MTITVTFEEPFILRLNQKENILEFIYQKYHRVHKMTLQKLYNQDFNLFL